ncbi:uncharacterized protein LOC113774965 isoform X1 [Coffea eugenioides]|uniref:uncharacterized protein LOC113774965 isoform X1 n=1 Tax=Coffea eugenioides TaxID=49369 RepID=UPI000F6090A8|nr:uncharacterized protein LOC113774965 isoform X1 [Coffea eugenioides]
MKLKYGGHNTNTSSSIHTTHSGLNAVSLLCYYYSSNSWKAAVSRSRITFTTNTRAAGGGAPSDSKSGCRRWNRSPSLLILCYSYRPKFSSSSTNASTNRTRYNSPSKFNWSIPDAYKDSGDGPHHTDRLTDSDEELDDADCGGGDVDTEIQKTGYNRRRIQSRVSVDASLQSVWNVLTDYEKLADFIPGLAVSQLLQKTDNFARLFQIGQQNLAFGLKFKAKGVIDCYEKEIQNLPFGKRRDIEFEMIEGDFQLFQGKWCVEQISTGDYDIADSIKGQEFHTNLSYIVDVEPKVWLPVHLVQGRLCREIKMNLLCIKEAAERAIQNKVSGYE